MAMEAAIRDVLSGAPSILDREAKEFLRTCKRIFQKRYTDRWSEPKLLKKIIKFLELAAHGGFVWAFKHLNSKH
jgi:hypothetical protein